MSKVKLQMIVSVIIFFPILANSRIPPIGIIPNLPGEGPKQCWSSFQSINGCVMRIYTSFINGRAGSLGPACCKAITGTQSNCWHRMFPFNPELPPLLTNYCSSTAPTPSAAGLTYATQFDDEPKTASQKFTAPGFSRLWHK
ncbi:hypothetical protein ACHQM5_014763 [Ranunculus cassubicifolius]